MHHRRAFWVFAALLGSLHVAPATASGSFSLPFDSAASAGRGFAGLGADTEDPSALLVNPAASAWQTELRTVGGFHLAAYATRFRGEARRAATDDSRVDGGNGGNPGRLDLPLPELVAVRPLGERWHAGLRLNAPYGITLRYDPDWTGRYHAIDTIVRGIEFAPSVSFRVHDDWSIGGAVIVQQFIAEFSNDVDLGAVIQRQATAEAGADITTPACAAAGVPSLPGKYDFRNAFEIAQPGIGWQFGSLWRWSADGAIGIDYRAPITHRLDGRAERRRDGWTAQQLRDDPCLAPVELALTLQGRSFEQTVVQPALRSSEPTGFTSLFTIPESLAIHWMNRVGALTLSAGARWTRWEAIDSIRFRFDNGAPPVTEPLRFESSLRVTGGLAWQAADRWTLRAGVAYETSTVDNDTRTARAPDGHRAVFTAGLGYRLAPAWHIDAAAGYLRTGSRPVSDLATASGSGNRLDGRYDALRLGYVSGRLIWTPGANE